MKVVKLGYLNLRFPDDFPDDAFLINLSFTLMTFDPSSKGHQGKNF